MPAAGLQGAVEDILRALAKQTIVVLKRGKQELKSLLLPVPLSLIPTGLANIWTAIKSNELVNKSDSGDLSSRNRFLNCSGSCGRRAGHQRTKPLSVEAMKWSTAKWSTKLEEEGSWNHYPAGCAGTVMQFTFIQLGQGGTGGGNHSANCRKMGLRRWL